MTASKKEEMQNSRNKKVTFYDIANETNLSIATVSRILNQKGSYSARSEALVMETARKLGYFPNILGSNGTAGSTHTIGVHYPYEADMEDPNGFFMQYFSGVASEAAQNDYRVLVHRNPGDTVDRHNLLFDSSRYDALLTAFSGDSMRRDIETMIQNGYHVSYAGARLPGDTVGYNIYGGYIHYKREVLELLYSLGYRNIAVFELFTQAKNLSRIETFRSVVEDFRVEKGLPENKCRMIIYDKSTPGQIQTLMKNLLEDEENRPEVLFLDMVTVAVSAYNVAQNMGLRIPEDIGIISTSHSKRSGEEFSPSLATVCVNAQEMGSRSVKLLLHRMEGRSEEIDRNVPYEIHMRKSLRTME